MKISVVVTTYNRGWVLRKTLPAMLTQDLPPSDYEVIVVVDGSTDDSAEYARQFERDYCLRVIEQPNRERSAARNTGWRAARAPLILFLDDDIICTPGLVRAHIAAHEKTADIVVMGAVPTAPDSPPSLASDAAKDSDQRWTERVREDGTVPPESATVDANTSVPRLALEQAGGFDESLHRRENVAMAFALRKLGLRFHYLPEAIGWHYYEKTARAIVSKDSIEIGAYEVRVCRRYPEYRRYSTLRRLGDAGPLKQFVRQAAASDSVSLHRILAAPLVIAERLRGTAWAKNMGVRMLRAASGAALFQSASHEAGGWDRLEEEFGRRVPCLLYHNVGEMTQLAQRDLTVSTRFFQRQMHWLKANDYEPITAADWLAWVNAAHPLPRKPVLLTFDDAYQSLVANAFPLLEQLMFKATVFVPSRLLGGRMPWDGAAVMTSHQVREWASRGIEFGSHTRTHADLRGLPDMQLDAEVRGSRQDLEDVLGSRVTSFAYPFGHVDARACEAAAASYEAAFSTIEGMNNLATDPYMLRRSVVELDDNPVFFESRLRLGYSPVHRLRIQLGIRTRLRRAWRAFAAISQ